MINFAVEPWATVRDDIGPLWHRHYAEIGQDKDRIPLDPDWDGYGKLEDVGMLFIVAGRREGKLVAYTFAFVSPHLHYRTILFANFDMYWVEPECRGGRTALRMFQFVEERLKDRGVVKIVANTKLSHDHGRLFEHLGYREAERIFVKVI